MTGHLGDVTYLCSTITPRKKKKWRHGMISEGGRSQVGLSALSVSVIPLPTERSLELQLCGMMLGKIDRRCPKCVQMTFVSSYYYGRTENYMYLRYKGSFFLKRVISRDDSKNGIIRSKFFLFILYTKKLLWIPDSFRHSYEEWS